MSDVHQCALSLSDLGSMFSAISAELAKRALEEMRIVHLARDKTRNT